MTGDEGQPVNVDKPAWAAGARKRYEAELAEGKEIRSAGGEPSAAPDAPSVGAAAAPPAEKLSRAKAQARNRIGKPDHDSSRRALAAFLMSEEGVQWTLDKALEAAEVKKETSFACPKCNYRGRVTINDATASVNALKFMHEWGLTKPKDDGDSVPKVRRLADLTPAQRDKLRELVYSRAAQE